MNAKSLSSLFSCTEIRYACQAIVFWIFTWFYRRSLIQRQPNVLGWRVHSPINNYFPLGLTDQTSAKNRRTPALSNDTFFSCLTEKFFHRSLLENISINLLYFQMKQTVFNAKFQLNIHHKSYWQWLKRNTM